MTIDIEKLLEETGLPFRYHHFEEEEVPQLPYIVYLFPESNNFGADGIVYADISQLQIELYTETKDIDTEKIVEDVLTKNGIYYDKDETYIESEKMYMVVYGMEVLR